LERALSEQAEELVALRASLHTSRRRVWVALGAMLILYVFAALRVNPVAAFGLRSDDALYFASAKSLAQGHGYFLPSFPVQLRATKYPELYPLILAGIWKLDPRFPNNVNLAAGLTLAFGCAALLFVFLLMRRWPGITDWEALVIVALCAFVSVFLQLSVSVLTDLPFMATMLGAVWLAELSTDRPGKHVYWVLGSGALAGLSVGFRSLGVAVVGGIALAFLLRRDFRRLLLFCAAAAPVALLAMWPAVVAILHPSGTQSALGPGDSGWTQTLCYYSSYACNWRMNVSGPAMLKDIIITNLKLLVEAPGLLLLSPLASGGQIWSIVLISVTSLASYAGIAHYLREKGWQPLPLVFGLYLLVILAWPYPPRRFLLVFLPLFCGGLWIEGKRLGALIVQSFRRSQAFGERASAVLLAAAGIALAATVAINYAFAMPAELAGKARQNAENLAAQRGVYRWLRQHAAPTDRVISYDDGLLYLYTGSRSVVPIAWTTQGIYSGDPQYLRHDEVHLADVARKIGASFWLVTPWDFDTDGAEYQPLSQREKQVLAGTPVVFQDAAGKVRLYDVHCRYAAVRVGCPEQSTASAQRLDRDSQETVSATRLRGK
jgi:hypothetical protein